MNDSLPLIFDPRTIGDLGIKMYTRLPHGLVESISNAYDADAKKITISIQQDKNSVKSIEIEDDGLGMSREDLAKRFLIVGRKRRKEEEGDTSPNGRKITGRKGLGKLAMFGIANIVEVRTIKNGKMNMFQMDWRDIEKSQDDKCSFKLIENDVDTQMSSGTKITLTEVKRKTKIDVKELAVSLSRRVNFGNDFLVVVKEGDGNEYTLSNKLRVEGIDIEGEFQVGDEQIPEQHNVFKGKIKGIIKTARSPLPRKDMQGVSLFARNKLVNEPTAFGSASSNFFRYITGEIHIDFIEDKEEDMVATNRRTLDWDNEELKPLEDCLKDIINGTEKKWREMRKESATKKISEKLSSIDFKKYQENIPDDKKEPLRSLFLLAEEHPDREEKIVSDVLEIVPEYAEFHWRYLHKKLKKENKILADYKKKDYTSALTKAWEIYEMELKKVSGEKNMSGAKLINEYLSKDSKDGKDCGSLEKVPLDKAVKNDLEESNFCIARGCCAAANITRHHETATKKKEVDFSKNIFTDKDCLDILSSISHLLYRLETDIIKAKIQERTHTK